MSAIIDNESKSIKITNDAGGVQTIQEAWAVDKDSNETLVYQSKYLSIKFSRISSSPKNTMQYQIVYLDGTTSLITLKDGIFSKIKYHNVDYIQPYADQDAVGFLTIAGKGVTKLKKLCSGLINMSYFYFSGFDLSIVEDMSYMFENTRVSTGPSTMNVSSVTNMSYMFSGVMSNPNISTWDVSKVTNFEGMFYNNGNITTDLKTWDVSSATNMKDMFNGAYRFNKLINSWDTTNVTDMSGMFKGATAFNQSLSLWRTSFVTNMNSMFYEATNFNQPIGNWDTANVTNMEAMFYKATNFNQPIGNWDTSNVTKMTIMFNYASNFNQPLSNWNTSKVKTIGLMFAYATNFNGHVGNWDTSSITDMSGCFSYATKFNRPVGEWDLSSVSKIDNMFHGATDFNQHLFNWNVLGVTSLKNLLNGTSFNQDLSHWDTSNITNMSGLFQGTPFNLDCLYDWDVSNVNDFSYMFYGATKFNRDLSKWKLLASDISMVNMFYGADDYNTSLFDWDTTNVAAFDGMFNNVPQLEQDFTSWSNASVISPPANMFTSTAIRPPKLSSWMPEYSTPYLKYTVNAGSDVLDLIIRYTDGSSDNTTIASGSKVINFDTYASGKTILNVEGNSTNLGRNLDVRIEGIPTSCESLCANMQGTINIDNIDTSLCEDFTAMLFHCEGSVIGLSDIRLDRAKYFNNMFAYADLNVVSVGAIVNNWDVSNVTNMTYMFDHCKTPFTPDDLLMWDVSNVNNMSAMFRDYDQLLPSLQSWDVSSVLAFYNMFYGITDGSTLHIANWDVSNATDFSLMFYRANGIADLNLKNWDTTNVLSMNQMFSISDFNSDIFSWTINPACDMSHIFDGGGFDQNIAAWEIPKTYTAFPTTLSSYNQPFWGSGYVQSIYIKPTNYTNPNHIPVVYCYLYDKDDNLIGSASTLGSDGEMSYPGYIAADDAFTFNVDSAAGEYVTLSGIAFSGVEVKGNVTNTKNLLKGIYSIVSVDICLPFRRISNMEGMFSGCTNLGMTTYSKIQGNSTNSPIINNAEFLSSWDVYSVENFTNMFKDCVSLNQDLTDWDAYSLSNFTGMFDGATSFSPYCMPKTHPQYLESNSVTIRVGVKDVNDDTFVTIYDTDPTTTTADYGVMRAGTNDPIKVNYEGYGVTGTKYITSGSNGSGIYNIKASGSILTGLNLFQNGELTRLDVTNLQTHNCNTFDNMFNTSEIGDIDLNHFDTSNVTSMNNVFGYCEQFNGNISLWDTSKVTSMVDIFRSSGFNGDISKWNTSSLVDMSWAFYNTKFNKPLGDWDTSKTNLFVGTFDSQQYFNQYIGRWSNEAIPRVDIYLNTYYMFDDGNNLSILDPNNKAWWMPDFNENVVINIVSTTNGASDVAFSYQWYSDGIGINDSGIVTSVINIPTGVDVNLSDIGFNFRPSVEAAAIITEITLKGLIVDASYILSDLRKCEKFNLDELDTTQCINMSYMFAGSTLFNEDISHFRTGNVGSMKGMFLNCENFSMPIGGWYTGNVVDMDSMFKNAKVFNQDLTNWSNYSNPTVVDMFDGAAIMPNSKKAYWMYSDFENKLYITINSATTPTVSYGIIDKYNKLTELVMTIGQEYEIDFTDNLYIKPFNNPNALAITEITVSGSTSNLNDLFVGLSNCAKFNLSGLETNQTINMARMFGFCTLFNDDISWWKTNLVSDMRDMFKECTSLNQSLVNWKNYSSPVTDGMLDGANNLTNTDRAWWMPGATSAVLYITVLTSIKPSNDFIINYNDGSNAIVALDTGVEYFYNYSDDNIKNIQPSGVNTDIISIRYEGNPPAVNALCKNLTNCKGFDIKTLRLDNATDASEMFYGCRLFTEDISDWDVSTITNMIGMFNHATRFNRDISGWDVSNVTSARYMFNDATSFNRDLSNWNVRSMTDMSGMFKDTFVDFDASQWNVSKVTDFSEMFRNTPFNSDINQWDTSSAVNMSSMFQDNIIFNKNIYDWDVQNCTDFSNMFNGATAFDQDINRWKNAGTPVVTDMLLNCPTGNPYLAQWMDGYESNITISWNGTYTGTAVSSGDSVIVGYATLDDDDNYISQVTDTLSPYNGSVSFTGLGPNDSVVFGFVDGDRSNYTFDYIKIEGSSRNAWSLFANFDFTNAINTNIDITNFRTPSATTMENMLYNCQCIVDISKFDLEWIRIARFALAHAINFNEPIKTNFSKCTDMYATLDNIPSFTQDISHFVTDNVTEFYASLYTTPLLRSYLGNWKDTNRIASDGNLFNSDTGVSPYDRAPWMDGYIASTVNLITLTVNTFIDNCDSCKYVIHCNDISSPDHLSTITLYRTIPFTLSFQSRDIDYLMPSDNTDKVSKLTIAGKPLSLNNICNNMLSLKEVTVKDLDLTSCTNIDSAFIGCNSLSIIDLDSLDVSYVTNMVSAFESCWALDVPMHSWDTTNVEDFSRMFCGTNIYNQDLSTWGYNGTALTTDMFVDSNESPYNMAWWMPGYLPPPATLSITLQTDDGLDAEYTVVYNDGSTGISYIPSRFTTTFYYDDDDINYMFPNYPADILSITLAGSPRSLYKLCDGLTNCTYFDISELKVDRCSSFSYAFNNCYNFNEPEVVNWNVSNGVYMNFLFGRCYNFNQPIGNWDMSGVVNIGYMLLSCHYFNQNVNDWDTSNVTYARQFISVLDNFNKYPNPYNQPMDKWDLSKNSDMLYFFAGCRNFNQDISMWDVGSCKIFLACFASNYAFEQDLGGWNMSSATNFQNFFSNAHKVNFDASGWNTSKITTLSNCFSDSRAWNGDVSTWDTSNVSTMSLVFNKAINFNQDVSNWDTRKVKTFARAFASTTVFDQNLTRWSNAGLDPTDDTTMTDMFTDSNSTPSNRAVWMPGWMPLYIAPNGLYGERPTWLEGSTWGVWDDTTTTP